MKFSGSPQESQLSLGRPVNDSSDDSQTPPSPALPLVAITLGDPAGIGPEVIVRAWAGGTLQRWCRPLVVGHPQWLRRAATLLGVPIEVIQLAGPEDLNRFAMSQPTSSMAAGVSQVGPIFCVAVGGESLLHVRPGTIDPAGGEAAVGAVVKATQWALLGGVDALVTAPLCKQSLQLAGHDVPGHTELLADLCGVERAEVGMMLYLASDQQIRGSGGLGVVHVTLHTALRRIWEELSVGNVLAKTRLIAELMGRIKGEPARVAVCSLNPHAGEGGLFGDEEQSIIAPAVMQARTEGLQVAGPLPNDTLFASARDGHYDGVVAMYHDQGHIPLKLLGLHRAVNVTLGLPIVRTSVAHGTAFDLAWQGKADCGSLCEAVRIACLLAVQNNLSTHT